MTALTADFKADKLGTEDLVYPVLVKYPVEASTSIYAGAIVALNTSGNAVPASATASQKIVGRAERQTINQTTGGTSSPDGIASGSAGSIKVTVRQGVFYYNVNADSTLDATSVGKSVYASDDNTVSLSDAGGTRPYAGWIVDPATAASMKGSTTLAGIFLGVANPYASVAEIAVSTISPLFKCRAVVTSLAAYTGTGTGTLTGSVNGAFGAQDGVTVAANDVVFIPEGTTNLTAAKDAGPWQISVLGTAGTKYVLIRPDWWTNGSTIQIGQVIDVDGEGTTFPGTQWKTFAATGKVVGTDAPVFWPKVVQGSTALVGGTFTISQPVRSTTATVVTLTRIVANTTAATIMYATTVAGANGLTAGVTGTGQVVVQAVVAAGTINANDVSTLAWAVQNW